jgi:hypothetical protein
MPLGNSNQDWVLTNSIHGAGGGITLVDTCGAVNMIYLPVFSRQHSIVGTEKYQVQQE